MSSSMAICVAEDRISDEEPVRLCVASVSRANPDCPIVAFLPNASTSLQRWLARQSGVELQRKLVEGRFGWNVKPHALLSVLDRGYQCAWWVDSDVIVRHSLSARYARVDERAFIATEEALLGAHSDYGLRARGWGFVPARDFGYSLNSGVLRVSREHIALLLDWRGLLESSEYRAAQGIDWEQRPLHLAGDQDILTALLCSEKYAAVEVRILERGSDIIQYYGSGGYTLRERLGNLINGGATFVHSQGFKPWRDSEDRVSNALRRYFRQILSDTSVYLLEARRLREVTELTLPWTTARTSVGKILRLMGFGSNFLTGLPMAVLCDVSRVIRRAR